MLRGRERDAAGPAETEQVAVDRLGVEAIRLFVAAAFRRALREAERDQRLRADLCEALLERRLACADAVQRVFRFGDEECAEGEIFGLERRVARGGGLGEARERRDRGARVVGRARAAEAILEAAREELRARDVGRKASRVARANE